jgi:hypothetical protein
MKHSSPSPYDEEELLTEDFSEWGLKEDVAFIKKDIINHHTVWAIYNPEGAYIGCAKDRQTALALAAQNDLTVMSAH